MSSAKLVRDVMTRSVVSLRRDDLLVSADDIMRLGRIRHLPVLDDAGKLVGVVTQTDLFRGAVLRALGYGPQAQRSLSAGISVSDAMTREVVTVSPETPIQEAARLLMQRKIGCLPVLANGKLAGILTESDFVKLQADPS
jgi:CBS domain-containing protein